MMKIEKNFFLPCESFLLDNNQRASLINIYDVIGAESFPAIHPLLKYVANVKLLESGNIKDITLTFELKSPTSEILNKQTIPSIKIAQKTKEQNIGMILDIQNVTLQKPGTYVAELLFENKVLATHKIEVIKRPTTEL